MLLCMPSVKNQGLGSAVYCTFTEGQAMRIGDCRTKYNGTYDVWKVTASQSDITVVEHPPWCGMEEFKEVMVPEVEPKNLCLVR